jgi:hypothetical protein
LTASTGFNTAKADVRHSKNLREVYAKHNLRDWKF